MALRSRSLSLLGCSATVLALSAAFCPAVDFIRGDANEDGIVTIADSYRIVQVLFFGWNGDFCGDAADFNNDGSCNLTDAIKILQYQVLLGEPPSSPFPSPGPDTGGHDPIIDANWPCTSFGGGQPLEDPAAIIRVLDSVVTGGRDRKASILLAISNSTRVAGYFAEIDASALFPATASTQEGVRHEVDDLTGTFAAGFAAAATDPSTGRLKIGFLTTFVGEIWIPPGENQLVLEVRVCLDPGTRAGAYPLHLTAGEIVDYESGRRIEPQLMDGVLTITDGIPADDCVIETYDPGHRNQLDIVFKLGETSGAPGSEVEVPFLVKTTDQAVTQGLRFSIDFDETALELVSIHAALKRPDGEPSSYPIYQFENSDLKPGNDVDEGYSTGFYYLDAIGGDAPRFPTNEEFVALDLRFHIKPDATIGSAEVAFRDGGKYCFHVQNDVQNETICYPWTNRLISGQAELSPEFVNSFVLVNGLVNIIPDVTIFLRGDSNGDGKVDISDAQTTLGYLFLGDRRPYCFDAADANDDGRLDISDPLETLQFLFLGRDPLPAPSEEPGKDPTPDGITCSSIQ